MSDTVKIYVPWGLGLSEEVLYTELDARAFKDTEGKVMFEVSRGHRTTYFYEGEVRYTKDDAFADSWLEILSEIDRIEHEIDERQQKIHKLRKLLVQAAREKNADGR